MSFTLAQFRTSLRYTLSDQAIWKDSQLNSWIKDGIREYSQYYPYHDILEITTSAGTREYTLTGTPSILSVVFVEYPSGQIPRRFLERRSMKDADFYNAPCYDIWGDPPETIYIGENPANLQTIVVGLATIHTIPAGDASTLTIPDQHAELLRLFVVWKATVYLEGYSGIDPGRKSAMISSLGRTADQAEKFYYWSVDRTIKMSARSGPTGPWEMDKKDRIY